MDILGRVVIMIFLVVCDSDILNSTELSQAMKNRIDRMKYRYSSEYLDCLRYLEGLQNEKQAL